jgi:Holliday junction resolvase RusA-like endonuclease
MGTERVAFFVPGDPVPQGSMRPMVSRTTGRVLALHSKGAELEAWREMIGYTARQAGCFPRAGAVYVTFDFYLRRPKSVRRALPTVPPDADKLARACFDALSGVAYIDDAQVVGLVAFKHYADDRGAGVHIELKIVE